MANKLSTRPCEFCGAPIQIDDKLGEVYPSCDCEEKYEENNEEEKEKI